MVEDLTGARFGNLVVTSRDFSRKNKVYWICTCDCTATLSLRADNIKKRTPAYQKCRECQINQFFENFIRKLEAIHGNNFDYSESDRSGVALDYKFSILCRNCSSTFTAKAGNHITNGCTVCSRNELREASLDRFIKTAREIFNEIYDLSLVPENFVDYKHRVPVMCEHGTSFAKPSGMVQGYHPCQKCCRTSRTTEEFIALAKEKQGDRYDYSLAEYCGSSEPISIICNKHGIFKPRATVHLRGAECPSCSNEKNTFDFVEKYTKFPELGQKIGSFYVLEMQSESEHFLKLGICQTLRKRLNAYRRDCPYSVSCLYELRLKNLDAAIFENDILSEFAKDFKNLCYIPANNFDGKSECVSLEALPIIKDRLSCLIKSHLH